ncbi:hypothetical protein FRC17_009498 [Serendipita sp. 399]|nr:hypothetical protein FRC17_009498 [Serendipita sp. 399]
MNVLVALIGLVAVAQAGSSSCVASNKKVIAAVRFRFIPTAISTGHTISSWSDGGGHRATITADANPFAGREYAGGNRGNILGTRAYGSGYPYGASDVTTLKGRPFPHVMWPISWGPGYMGGDEYWDSELDLLRPGGVLGAWAF